MGPMMAPDPNNTCGSTILLASPNTNGYPKGKPPSRMTHTQPDKDDTTRYQSTSFNWAANVNESPDPVPTFVDYGPTAIKHMQAVRHANKSLCPPLSVMNLQPAPLPVDNLIPPLQPVHTTPKHAVTTLKHDVALL